MGTHLLRKKMARAVRRGKQRTLQLYRGTKAGRLLTAAEVKSLYVRRQYQGKGLGRVLMDNLLLKLKRMGYTRVVLDAVPPTKKAQELYELMGFEEIEPYFFNPTPGTKFYGLDLQSYALESNA